MTAYFKNTNLIGMESNYKNFTQKTCRNLSYKVTNYARLKYSVM